jgi:putative methyltransferase (TIGR04325 family)
MAGPNVRSLIVDLTPPVLLRLAQRLRRRAHGMRWHNFEGAWPTLADVPVTRKPDDDDPWAQTIGAAWRENFKTAGVTGPTVDNTGKLILPLLASQFAKQLTVLDFGGGAGVGLANILGYARNLDLSRFSYVLVETPAMCRTVRGEIEAHSGAVVEEIPDALPMPLIVHAGSSLQYVSDYQAILSRLARLAPEYFIVAQTPMSDCPTYACQILSIPHRTLATWVFNRAQFVAKMQAIGYRLIFSVDHDLPLTHKNAPGPSVIASMVFSPAVRQSNLSAIGSTLLRET